MPTGFVRFQFLIPMPVWWVNCDIEPRVHPKNCLSPLGGEEEPGVCRAGEGGDLIDKLSKMNLAVLIICN